MGYAERIERAYASCPKAAMRRNYHGDDSDAHRGGGGLWEKDGNRWKTAPSDARRPTMESAFAVFDCVMCCAVRDFTGDERGMMQGARCTLTKMAVLRKISLQRIRGGQRSTKSRKNWRRIKRRCRSRRCTRRSLREISPVYWTNS